MRHELPRSLANGHRDSDPSAAADQQQEEEARNCKGSIPENLVLCGRCARNGGDAEIARGNRGNVDNACIVEEDNSSQGEEDDDSEGRSPHDQPCQALQQIHKDE